MVQVQPASAPAPTTSSLEGDAASDKAFSSAFAEASNPEPSDEPASKVAEKPVSTTAETPVSTETSGKPGSEPAVATPPVDPWASAPPELQAARKEWDTQKAGLQEQLNRRMREIDRLKAGGTPKAPAAAKKDEKAAEAVDADLKQFMEEYPDIAGPVKKLLSGLEAQIKTAGETIKNLSERAQRADLTAEETSLSQVHPDWKQATAGQAFMAWINTQPEFVRSIAIKNGDQIVDAQEAGYLISLYKSQTGQKSAVPPAPPAPPPPPPKPPLNERQKRQLEGSTTAPHRSPSPAAEGGADDFSSHFNAASQAASRASARA